MPIFILTSVCIFLYLSPCRYLCLYPLLQRPQQTSPPPPPAPPLNPRPKLHSVPKKRRNWPRNRRVRPSSVETREFGSPTTLGSPPPPSAPGFAGLSRLCWLSESPTNRTPPSRSPDPNLDIHHHLSPSLLTNFARKKSDNNVREYKTQRLTTQWFRIALRVICPSFRVNHALRICLLTLLFPLASLCPNRFIW